jgi:methanogenic corrinoid protein MtbC1
MEREGEPKRRQAHFPAIGEVGEYYSLSPAPELLFQPDAHERRARLASVLAEEIVPRLLTIHHRIRSDTVSVPLAEEIEEFGSLAMSADIGTTSLYFEAMRAKGHSVESLFVNLLAPTARHLGELWEQDRCDFIDVTIGVARLQQLLDIFGTADERPILDLHQRALLITTVGEKHLFGVDMVARFMRAAGWEVSVGASLGPKESASLAAREWYGVLGLTLSAESGLEVAAATISAVRQASCNSAISVIVGGPLFVDRPDLAVQVGADAAAVDAPTAVILAKKLLMSAAR